MAIKAKMTSNLTWLNDAYAVTSELSQLIAIAGDEAMAEIEQPLLAELQEQPPLSKGVAPNWTSALQRMAYFASKGFGRGIPYKRSGKLSQAWEIVGQLISDTWVIVVSNPMEAARFVYGSLAISNFSAAARFQQRFHAITGWKLAAPIVSKWFDEYQNLFEEKMDMLIGEIGTREFKRRGFTARLPKRKRK